MDTRIKILEQDLTTSTTTADTTDVAYVPGFATMGPFRTPTYCKNLSAFITIFGKTVPTFDSHQYYPVYKAKTETSPEEEGFDELALDSTTKDSSGKYPWFRAGDPDPSFLYAYELLSAGMPVVFERLRTTIEGKGITPVESLTGSPSVGDYYRSLVHGDNFSSLDGKVTYDDPAVFAEPQKGTPMVPYILDKGFCNIKYITAGGYPVFEYSVNIGQRMANIAANIQSAETDEETGRGDCIAFIDHTDFAGRMLTGVKKNGETVTECSVYYQMTNNPKHTVVQSGSNAAMFTPWGKYAMAGSYSITLDTMRFPASFAYLRCFIKSAKSNPAWLAISGVSRGLVPGLSELCTTKPLSNTVAESYQVEEGKSKTDTGLAYNISINPITTIRPYGLCIWGNRTLLDYNPTEAGFATGFLNVRNLLCDVKKQAYLTAQSLMFEQNNDALWIEFKAMMTPLLDDMVSSSVISTYKLVKSASTSVRTKMYCQIVLYPVYSVEAFTINITLSDEEVSVD